MTRYRLSALPETGIRSSIAVDDRNAIEVAARVGPAIAYRMACRTVDANLSSDALRQSVWTAIRGPESADDAAAAHGTDAAWVRMVLDKREKYLHAIATRLGLSPKAANRAQFDDLEPEPARPSQPAAVRSGSPFGADWSKRGGSLDRSDGTGTAKVKKTAVQPELRRRAETAARTAADELGVMVPMVKFYSDRGSAVRADANGLYQSATPTTVWIAADIPSVLSIPTVVRHEVAHYAQAMRGRPFDEPEASAFAAGKKAARVALRG